MSCGREEVKKKRLNNNLQTAVTDSISMLRSFQDNPIAASRALLLVMTAENDVVIRLAIPELLLTLGRMPHASVQVRDVH
jgi:hypothetical protein